MTVLFEPADLASHLGGSVTAERGAMVERVVWGWLRPIVSPGGEKPYPVDPELFSWAIELGGIAHENPAGLSAKAIGPASESFSSERRKEILDEVRTAYATAGAAAPGAPLGCFPPARPYPDAAW